MPTWTETKKDYELSMQKLNDLNLRELRVDRLESTGTTPSATYLLMRASKDFDTDPGINIRFDGVGYMQLPMYVAHFNFKLAHPLDSRPIETSLSMTLNPPIWVIC